MSRRSAVAIAWSGWALSLGALVAPFAYRLAGGSVAGLRDQPGSVAPTVSVPLFVFMFATVGAVLASKRPSNPIGWLLSASGLCDAIGTLAILIGRFSATWSDWLGNWAWSLGIGIAGTFVLLLFPTGTLPSRRWRPVAWFAGIALVATFLGNAFTPGVLQGAHSVNPVGIGGVAGSVLRLLQGAFGLVFLAGLACLASLAVRYRLAQSLEREQIKWLVYAAAAVVTGVIAAAVVVDLLGASEFSNNVQNAIVSGSFLLVPLAIGTAVMRYRLYDIDVVINKTVVFSALAAFITAVYVAVVVGLGALIGHDTSRPNLALSILATAVVAVAFQPVRERAQRFANRLVYGKRATPYEVLSDLSSRIAGTYASEDLIPRMARVLAEGTGARVATVWLTVGAELRAEASWPAEGRPVAVIPLVEGELPEISEASLSLPVHHRGELLGALTLAKKTGERLTPAEDKLASDLASQAGLVLRNVRLTEELLERLEELKASRQRIVAAQDAERRRLERNIHDGAQQQLVSLAVKVRLAETMSERDPARAEQMLSEADTDLAQALESLRDLARGIYPPLLADQGLPAALRAQARRAAVPIEIDVEGVGRYPQEAEAAVYFCCLEGLQNVAKYAHASGARVRLREQDGTLVFEVQDDGVGFDPSATGHGMGLQGMADRLSAQGGRLEVRSAPGQGATVIGRLPVSALEPVR